MKSNVYDLAVVCVDSAEKFMDANKDFVMLGPITMNSDILVRKNSTGKRIGVTSNKEYLTSFVQEIYNEEAEISYMSPHSFPYAYEIGEIDGFVTDIAELNDSIDGEILNVSHRDYNSNVMIANREILTDKKFKDFIRAFNETVNEYDKESNPEFFEFKYGKDERRNSVWKVKLQKINLAN
nr:hypothetical protein [Lagierella sp.]